MRTELRSFDGNEAIAAELVAPRRPGDLPAVAGDAPLIARGAGLSYCAASAGPGVRTIRTDGLDRVLDLDPAAGVASVEPGVRIGALFDLAAAHGWMPAAVPGHPRITVGGCIGFDVHGKSPRHGGCFGDRVASLRLWHPDHGEIECSPEREPEIFALTVGGFGLTGVVTRAELRLVRLPGGSVVRRREPVANLSEAVECMEARAPEAHALYSWNDLNRRGDHFGRGVVYVEHFDPEPRLAHRTDGSLTSERRGRGIPALWSRPLVRAYTGLYPRLAALRSRETRLAPGEAAFPLRRLELYFHAFGRRGFREYQLLVPRPAWPAAVAGLEALLARAGLPVTLGSLKLFDAPPALLRFRGRGVALALDVPATAGSRALFDRIDALLLDLGGIANLSKDGRLGAEVARRMFPDYERFRASLRAFDPKRRFDSALRRRLDV